MRNGRHGSVLTETLVAITITGVALGGLSGAAGVTRAGLAIARARTVALTLATERLEALRAGPRTDGADAPRGPDGTRYVRRWQVAGGRGNPTRLTAEVTWRDRRLTLATAVLP